MYKIGDLLNCSKKEFLPCGPEEIPIYNFISLNGHGLCVGYKNIWSSWILFMECFNSDPRLRPKLIEINDRLYMEKKYEHGIFCYIILFNKEKYFLIEPEIKI